MKCWLKLLLGIGLLAVGLQADAALRDPTRPQGFTDESGSAAAEKQRFILTAILRREGRDVAIVNGEVLQVGDSINGVDLQAIHTNEVIMHDSLEDRNIKVKLHHLRLKLNLQDGKSNEKTTQP